MSNPAEVYYEEERKWTYADYRGWELKPGERFELIDGGAYAMSAPNTEHQHISMILSAKLFNFFEGKTCQPFATPFDVRLFYEEDDSDDTVVQPDLVVVCDPEKLGEEGCQGAPDLVVDILSPSNTAIEMHRKLNLYLDAEVREYWVIDPEERLVEIYDLEDERYKTRILRIDDTLQSTVFPDFAIPMKTIFPEK
ncbi:MAG: Uma2 family endonuclease [Treponema sp.]|jgi:Uma2 family endonuclease|nr:Uma2 family endonuclease [Treponema sp.]